MSEKNDFDEMLGRDYTVTIALKTHSEQILFRHHPDDPNKLVTFEDTPDYVYNISTNEMTKIEIGTVSEHAYTSMLKHYITPEEYSSALKQLPNNLKSYALPYTEYDEDFSNNVVPENWLETNYQYINPKFKQESDESNDFKYSFKIKKFPYKGLNHTPEPD